MPGISPKPVKVSLRMKDKVAKSPNELLRWIKGFILDPGGCYIGCLS
jgi:hypothetical protein